MASLAPILETKSLGRSFGGLRAVNDVDFTLPAGQVRALIGPNGAGKSTFVGMLCGRIQASDGSVSFKGQDITKLDAHLRIGLGIAYTFQITSIFDRLTLHENVALAARRAMPGKPKDEIEDRVQDVLVRAGIADRKDQMANEQSYGHQRLLEIAMGLAQDPDLFILDEPTQGLAKAEVDAFKELITTLGGNKTVLLIEHNMNVVMETADYITVLNFGEKLAEGTPKEIHGNDAVQAAYLGKG